MGPFNIFVGEPLLVAAIVLVAYIYGRRLTLSVEYQSTFEKLAFSVTLGLGVIAYLVFFLGLARVLYWQLVIIVLLAGVAICYRVWMSWPREFAAQVVKPIAFAKARGVLAIATVVMLVLLPPVMMALYPPTAIDATLYHLAAAKAYATNHALILTPYLRFPVFPQHNEMLFTLALLLGNDVGAQLIEFAMMLTLTAALVAFGRRHFSLRAGIWAAALLLGNSLVLWLGAACYIDILLILNITLAVYGLYNWTCTREKCWLILSAAFCGFAVVTKYPGLVWVFLLAVAVFYACLRRRQLAPGVIFVGVALATMAPWLIRNCYYTGNPIFPFFNKPIGSLFGYRLWKPEYLQGLYETSFDGFNWIGVGRGFRALLTLPYHLAFDQSKFYGPALLSPIPLFLIPLLIYGGARSGKIRGLLILAICHTLYWFYTIQDIRYLLPALPLLCLAGAASCDLGLRAIPGFGSRRVLVPLTALFVALALYQGWRYSLRTLHHLGPIPVTQQARDAYVARTFPTYDAYKLLNETQGSHYTLYALFDCPTIYFADGLAMGDYWGPARYELVSSKITDGAALFAQLRELGADFFLFNNVHKLRLPADRFFPQHFRLIYQKDNVFLFQLIDFPGPTP